MSGLTINPVLTTNAAGTFSTTTAGYLQGTAQNDPSVRNELAGGIMLPSSANPAIWGGVGISELIPNPTVSSSNPSDDLGTLVDWATTLTAGLAGSLTGFAVFDQNASMVTSPQNPVPIAFPSMGVLFYRLGTNARIAVKCDPNLASLEGKATTTQVSWDFVNQQLIPYTSDTVNSGTYNSTTGIVSLTTATAHGLLPGDTFIPVLTGTGSYANLNVQQTATPGTTGTTLNFQAAANLTLTITGGSVSTSGALNVRVLDVNIGGSMEVDLVNGNYVWNRAGNTAVILI